MTKTIEELAKQYAKYQTDEQGYGSMEEWKQDVAIYYDDAKAVLSWLFDKPLASRLTAEEKERVRKIHRDYHQKWDCSCNDRESERSFYCFSLLERIFGADFFKEGE